MLTLVSGKPESVCASIIKFYDEAAAREESACIFSLSEHVSKYGSRYVLDLGSLNHPEEVAVRLFDLLRRMDREGVNCIFSEVVEANGLGLAIMNRLNRAASFRIIDADKA